MPGTMKQGQSIFIPFKDGKSIYDSQNKARMYMSEAKFRASFPDWRFGEVDLVEYAPKPAWISVEDRLPDKYTIVLCYKDKQWRLGYYIGTSYSKGVAAFRYPKDQFVFGVTHWMPLPEPPKGE